MLDLTAELMKPVDIYTEVAAQVQERMADPVPVEVQTFESPFGKARVVMFSDGTPWFVAKDVCEGLGLNGVTKDHTRRLRSDQKTLLRYSGVSKHPELYTLIPEAARGAWSMTLINRGGFNDLILESRKPAAREYRQWVTDKVLPALQDTGTFTDAGHPSSRSPLQKPVKDKAHRNF